jgi:tetratricopeptide (TPR) repeat protein
MMNNYEQAAAGFTTYLTRFCPGGRYCLNATYYAANSYYQLEQYDQAKELFINLTDIEGNPYMETACMRVAELSYDNKDFTTALDYFQRMHKVVSNQQMNQIALLGMLRCSYFVKNNLATITHATEILAIDGLSATIRNEALYYRADAYMTAKQYKLALNDYAPIAQEVRTAWGAEAKYRIAEAYYLLGETEKAEKEIMSFTSMQTTHQYWLAKSLILLADINVDNNDFFQAKQYLLALQNNYRPDDEIKQIIVEKLEKIYEVEAQQNIEITENE